MLVRLRGVYRRLRWRHAMARFGCSADEAAMYERAFGRTWCRETVTLKKTARMMGEGHGHP